MLITISGTSMMGCHPLLHVQSPLEPTRNDRIGAYKRDAPHPESQVRVPECPGEVRARLATHMKGFGVQIAEGKAEGKQVLITISGAGRSSSLRAQPPSGGIGPRWLTQAVAGALGMREGEGERWTGKGASGVGRASLAPDVGLDAGKYRFYDRLRWGEGGDLGPPLPPRKHEWDGRHKRVKHPGECEKKGGGRGGMPGQYRRTKR